MILVGVENGTPGGGRISRVKTTEEMHAEGSAPIQGSRNNKFLT